MPLSRGRKNSKKRKLSPKNSKNSYEKFSSNGVNVIRDGKNVYIKTNRSQQQQKELVERIKIERPKILESLKLSIERITEIFSTYNNLQLLGILAYNLFMRHNDPEDDGASELAMEYGLSFATAVKCDFSTEPTDDVGNEMIDTLYNIRQIYCQYIMTEFVEETHSEIENHLRFKTMLESLYMRGDGYPQHIYLVFEELFAGHNAFLLEKYGFTAKDILKTFLQLEDSFCCRVILPNGMPHPAAPIRFREWYIEDGINLSDSNNNQPMLKFLAENPDFVIENNRPSGYGISDLAQFENLYKIRYRYLIQKKVVAAVAMDFGKNIDFLNPKYAGLPLNESLSSIKPIIHYKNEYFLFAFNLLTRNIFSITERLIYDADKKYYNQKYLGNNNALSRDNYLENKTAALFKNFIPQSTPYLNLKYKPGQLDESGNKIETELDLLLISDSAIYIIEMKAGGLSAPAKRGALKSLTGQLSETVGYGAYQSHRAYKYITEGLQPEFYDSKGNVVAIDSSKKIFRITVTLEHLSGYIANMHDLKALGIVKTDVEFAWTCSLFDLIIFSEIVENEVDFIEYLEKRLPLYSNSSINVDDEIDFLGYFLETGELVDRKALKKVSSYKLNKTSDEIDKYFLKGAEKPKRKRTK